MSQLRCLRKTFSMVGRAIYESAGARQLFSVASLELPGRLLNELPTFANVLLSRQHITETNSDHGSPAQFCLVQIRATRPVDPFDNLAVDDVDLALVGGDESKTDHRHHHRRRQFETRVGFNPVREQIRESDV